MEIIESEIKVKKQTICLAEQQFMVISKGRPGFIPSEFNQSLLKRRIAESIWRVVSSTFSSVEAIENMFPNSAGEQGLQFQLHRLLKDLGFRKRAGLGELLRIKRGFFAKK